MKMKKRECIMKIRSKLAILCTIVILAAGGIYTFYKEVNCVPELTSYVDHEDQTVVINGEDVPMGGSPKVTTTTKTSKKTVKLKKPATKTYTKKNTKTKESTDNQTNGSNKIVTEKTVVTVTKKKYKKGSRKKVVVTKVTTTTKTSVEANEKDKKAKTVNIGQIASKLNTTVENAYDSLGFTVTIDPSVAYAGYFNARTQSITLREEGDTIYHEAGHFVAFVAGNVDQGTDFISIYNAEKGNYTGTNKNYVLQNSSEYFAESFRDYTLNPSELKKNRPRTYQAIENAIQKITPQQVNKLKIAYGPIWG